MPNGKLYLIPIEIASQTGKHVVPDQVKEVIKSLDYFLVENLRTARRFVSSLKLGLVIEELEFQVLDKKTNDGSLETLMKPIFLGRNVGVMSESGCPGIADPGAKAAAFAHRKGIDVVPLVGPSSIIMALMASGLNGQSFVFHGYLPIKKLELSKKIKAIEKQSQSNYGQAQIFIETPFRNNGMLESLVSHCHPDSMLCVATDLTGEKERIVSKTVKEWKKRSIELHKQPTVFIIQS